MKVNKKKILVVILIILSSLLIGFNVYSHSGRTDSNGGHKDNKNKSGLGSYHYHCGGYPAHLHNNGICPYSYKSTLKNPTSGGSKNTKPSIIVVEEVKVNEDIESINIGESRVLTVTITPNNATDKSITWKSSNDSILTVNSNGEIVAIKSGIAEVSATTSNNKTSVIKVIIKEREPSIIKTSIIESKQMGNVNNSEDSELLTWVITLGAVSAGGYWGYKKYKNKF